MIFVVRRFVTLLAAVGAAVAAPAAWANGDPASDVLPFTTVYYSAQNPKTSPVGRDLESLTKEALKKKLPIRVAVIYQPGDLGLIQSLWRKPGKYAQFLGEELVQFGNYKGTLVVAMPDGFGVHGPGATAAAKSALTKLPSPGQTGLDELGKDTVTAVRRVAAANGRSLPAPAASSGSSTRTLVVVAGAIAVALCVLAAGFAALRRWLTRP